MDRRGELSLSPAFDVVYSERRPEFATAADTPAATIDQIRANHRLKLPDH